MIKAVIYDIGGTLFESDTVGVDDRVFAGKKMLEMFKRHGFNFKFGPADMTAKVKTGEKEFKHWAAKHGYPDIYPYDLFSKWILKDEFKKMTPEQKKALKIISPHLINEFKKSVKGGMKGLRKNAEYMLDHFHRKGIKLGVISNTDSIDYVLLRLQYNDIYKYFEPSAVYLSAACQSRKPDPAMMIEICKELGVKPSEAVYVGDTISRDVIGSRAAKYRACIRIHSKNEAGSDAKTDPKLDTPFVVDSLTEVVEIVDELNTKKGANKHLKW